MAERRTIPRAGLLGALLTLTSLAGCASLGGGRPEVDPEAEARKRAPMQEIEEDPQRFLEGARGIYVLVDLDTNRLRLMDGGQALWEAPVGTGTGLRLRGDDGEWHFNTPQGVFRIQYKEEVPVWVLPDWYYVEKGLPVPEGDDESRRLPNQLGIAAVYLGEEIAIHGTDKPELLGRRVSHGCIRLENKYALRLFHNVQVGTPVVIVGGEGLEDEPPGESTDPGRPRPQARDSLSRYGTAQLLDLVERRLAEGDRTGSWVAYTSRLITRGHKDDATALRGILALAGKAKTPALEREFSTFLADAFARDPLRTVVSLARIEEAEREAAARGIVEATMALHPGSLEAQLAPWPTRRVPVTRLGPDGKRGWQALRTAEQALLERARRTNEERP
jgi:hypothetical protein